MSLTALYTAVRDRLDQPEVCKHIELYNSQEFGPDDEQTFYTPAVFLAFKDLRFETLLYDHQEVEGMLMVRCVYASLDPQFDNLYQMVDKVHETIQGFKDEDDVFTSLMRESGDQDTNFKHHQAFTMNYKFRCLEKKDGPIYEGQIDNLTFEISDARQSDKFNSGQFNPKEFE